MPDGYCPDCGTLMAQRSTLVEPSGLFTAAVISYGPLICGSCAAQQTIIKALFGPIQKPETTMTTPDETDMTLDEFEAAMEAGEPVEIVTTDDLLHDVEPTLTVDEVLDLSPDEVDELARWLADDRTEEEILAEIQTIVAAMEERRHPATEHLLQFFVFDHLPPHLQPISAHCHDLAYDMVSQIDDGPELTVGLRNLLIAKDCFVRAKLISSPRDM